MRQYPSAPTEQLRATTRGKEQQLPFILARAPDVVSYESSNLELSTIKSNTNVEVIARSAQPTTLSRKGFQNVQYVYEPEVFDRIARGKKPHTIEWDSAGRPIEATKVGSNF